MFESFTDTESDSINFDTFTFGGTHGSLFKGTQSGNAIVVTQILIYQVVIVFQ